ncbi:MULTISPECIES: hypothetical protein [Burkholderia cepacia complex]|uniref:hypothetical protein n=1 Tax=Burkholderia cepacia complex TaxID=87882 RepID=UPI000754D155|nr:MULTISPECIES: hypothetical protein [Burkholderia cepacia complex]KVQ85591.1 hypothetical protein WK07_04680 [Burkholderia multivorans]PRF55302.1 hypothetical protein C6Q11_05115 [Burkholderia multivorans]PRH31195.1 hypothetical protein C6T71_01265 [Burkholderia multivorans]QTD88720.1 hypothetical protein J4G50_12915 [Burkholderia anthina]
MSDDRPTLHSDLLPVDSPRLTLRDYYAAHVDVTIYRPIEVLSGRLGRTPSMKELATYIAEIRLMEADQIMKAREIP